MVEQEFGARMHGEHRAVPRDSSERRVSLDPSCDAAAANVDASRTVHDVERVEWRDRRAAEWQAYWATLPFRPELGIVEAAELVRRLATVLPLDRRARVLDFGCGFGFVAAALAPHVGAVDAWDPLPSMRRWTRAVTGALPNVRTLAPADAARFPELPVYDAVIVNSVLQYVGNDERRRLLHAWHGALRPEGRLVLSDLVAVTHALWRDVVPMARFYARRRCLMRFIRERCTDLRHYWTAERAAPLVRVGESVLRRDAAVAGFEIEMLPASLTHRPRRGAAILRPIGGAA
jgi:SAM-dependent methyltransferase